MAERKEEYYQSNQIHFTSINTDFSTHIGSAKEVLCLNIHCENSVDVYVYIYKNVDVDVDCLPHKRTSNKYCKCAGRKRP